MRLWKYLAIALAGLWLAVGIYVLIRQNKMEQLSEVALSPLSGKESASAAVARLSQFRGSTSTKLLLKIATAEREYLDGRQEMAVHELAVRGDSDAIDQLVILLQPFWGLSRREAVAAALERNPCDSVCAAVVLHYLERYWCGIGKWEDIPSTSSQEVYAALDRERAALNENLYDTLRTNQASTLSVLKGVYGLGSPQPSGFSLYVVEKLGLRGACPLLERSSRRLLDSSKSEKLQSLRHDLRCQSEPTGLREE